MSLLEPYVGRYVSAESASTKLDVSSILAGCDMVDSESDKLNVVGNKVNDIGDELTLDVLSVDGVGMGEKIVECCNSYFDSYDSIVGSTTQIRETAISKYNQLQQQLNDEARARDEYLIKQNQNKNNR